MTQMFMNLVFAFDVFEIIRLISPACKQVLDFTEFNGHWSVIFEIVGLVDFTKTAFADEPQALIFFAKDRPAFFGQVAVLFFLTESIPFVFFCKLMLYSFELCLCVFDIFHQKVSLSATLLRCVQSCFFRLQVSSSHHTGTLKVPNVFFSLLCKSPIYFSNRLQLMDYSIPEASQQTTVLFLLSLQLEMKFFSLLEKILLALLQLNSLLVEFLEKRFVGSGDVGVGGLGTGNFAEIMGDFPMILFSSGFDAIRLLFVRVLLLRCFLSLLLSHDKLRKAGFRKLFLYDPYRPFESQSQLLPFRFLGWLRQTQLFVIGPQLLPEPRVWIYPFSLAFDELVCLVQRHPLLLHEVGNRKTGTSGHPCRTVDQYVPFLLSHPLHPSVVVREILYDALLWEILNLKDFINVLRIFAEGSIEVSSTGADSCDVAFFEQLFGGRCIFIAKIDAFFDEINLWVFVGSGCLEVEHGLGLFVIAGPAYSVLIIVLQDLLGGLAEVALLGAVLSHLHDYETINKTITARKQKLHTVKCLGEQHVNQSYRQVLRVTIHKGIQTSLPVMELIDVHLRNDNQSRHIKQMRINEPIEMFI